MQVSIVIPTYNRAEDLDKCLNSLITQTILPKEIVIVDDSDNDEIENLIKQRKKEFKKEDVLLRHIRNEKERSSAIARNIGVENTTEDIILFLDSDVILDEDYIKEILKVYEGQQNALGVQGYITNISVSSFPLKLINKIFFNTNTEKNVNRLLPSVKNVYAVPLTKTINCEWMIGANSSYLREAVEEMGGFDERLLRWSAGDDDDLSYRVFKKYPGRLFQTPNARLIHNQSISGRLPKETISLMSEIYHKYLFYKIIDQTLINKFIWLCNKLGRLLRAAKRFFLNPSGESFLILKYLIKGYLECIHHSKEIKIGDLDFFNKRLE